MTTKLFVVFSVIFLALLGTAVYRDEASRDYVAIQDQYKATYGGDFNTQVQQLFPSYSAAKVGDTFRVERCISCHVPDIANIGPVEAAQRLSTDFFKNDPDAQAIAKANGLTGQHPAYVTIDSNCLSTSGTPTPAASPSSSSSTAASPAPSAQASDVPEPTATPKASPKGKTSAKASPSASASASPSATQTTANLSCTNGTPSISYAQYGAATNETFKSGTTTYSEPGYLPAIINPADPSVSTDGKVGIDQIGCIVCHNGNRLAVTVDDTTNSASRGAHENLIINPTYVWTEGASLYYQYCVTCHAEGGTGAIGPPLSNQDRLGYFNEDYYYRCIEFGETGFEHVGSAGVNGMPNWGSIAADYVPADHPGVTSVHQQRVLTETQITTLVQFIRHWQQYQNLP